MHIVNSAFRRGRVSIDSPQEEKKNRPEGDRVYLTISPRTTDYCGISAGRKPCPGRAQQCCFLGYTMSYGKYNNDITED